MAVEIIKSCEYVILIITVLSIDLKLFNRQVLFYVFQMQKDLTMCPSFNIQERLSPSGQPKKVIHSFI